MSRSPSLSVEFDAWCSGNYLVLENARPSQVELALEGVDLGEQSTLRPEYNVFEPNGSGCGTCAQTRMQVVIP